MTTYKAERIAIIGLEVFGVVSTAVGSIGLLTLYFFFCFCLFVITLGSQPAFQEFLREIDVRVLKKHVI